MLAANTSQESSKVSMNTSQASASTMVSTNTVQKPAAYRPPHAKNAATVKAEVCLLYL